MARLDTTWRKEIHYFASQQEFRRARMESGQNKSLQITMTKQISSKNEKVILLLSFLAVAALVTIAPSCPPPGIDNTDPCNPATTYTWSCPTGNTCGTAYCLAVCAPSTNSHCQPLGNNYVSFRRPVGPCNAPPPPPPPPSSP